MKQLLLSLLPIIKVCIQGIYKLLKEVYTLAAASSFNSGPRLINTGLSSSSRQPNNPLPLEVYAKFFS